jgi:ABC-type transport system involved in multi-copper enzyme maturation permease subunit
MNTTTTKGLPLHAGAAGHEPDAAISRGRVYVSLMRDAYLQVADNLVFRIMLGVVFAMVASTFAIGFRDDHVSLLFGLGKLDYESVLGSVGWFFGVVGTENRAATFVEQLQQSFANSIAGTFGALFSVVATSFFVPRMLEKGAADTLFSKPVTRGVLVLSRYFGSIVFVGILSTVLVFGMWAGFAVASGYTNPRFLWAAPMLIYQFALLAAFSTFFGALTRSSIATLLLTVLSWWGCIGTHTVWLLAFEYAPAMNELGRSERAEGDENEPEAGPADEHPLVAFIGDVVTIGHLVLPKTGDAAEVTELVRKTLHGETRTLLGGVSMRNQTLAVYERSDGGIVVTSPEGNEALFTQGRGALLTMEARRPVFVRVGLDGTIEAWTGSPRDARRAAEELEGAEDGEGGGAPTEVPDWATPAEVVPASEVGFGRDDPITFYRRRFTWDQEELGYSPLFSLASSLGFSLVLLLLATWRVRRMDF